MKKYICEGGEVISGDGDAHYISAYRVAELYQVNPDECIFIERNQRYILCGRKAGQNSMVTLRPQSDGNYTSPTKKN